MWQRIGRFEPLAGVVFVGLIVASGVLNSGMPDTNATGAKVVSYFRDHQHRQQASAYLIGLGVVVGLYFYGLLRARLRRDPRNEGLAAIGFAGAIVFGMSGVVSAGAILALAEHPSRLTADSALALNLIQAEIGVYMLGAGIGLLALAFGVAILRSRLLPRWLGITALIVAVVAATPLTFLAFAGIGLWTLAAGVTMFLRPLPPDMVLLPDVGTEPAAEVRHPEPLGRPTQPRGTV